MVLCLKTMARWFLRQFASITTMKLIQLPQRLISLLIALLFTLLSACGGGSETSPVSGQSAVSFDVPVIYIERNIKALDNDGNETDELVNYRVGMPSQSYYGARLLLRPRADLTAPARDLTTALWAEVGDGRYDVKDLSVSDDGKKVLFSMLAPDPSPNNDDDNPFWDIWEYDVEADTLRRVIVQDDIAVQGHDTGPAYLPDGRIVFSSTRQHDAKGILLDEGKPQYSAQASRDEEASVIHIMNADGTNVKQLSFSHQQEFDPTVLTTGRILFARRDLSGTTRGVSWYSINPNGTQLQLEYGGHSHNTGINGSVLVLSRPTQLEDGRIATLGLPEDTDRWGGDVQTVNITEFIDNEQPTNANSGSTEKAQKSLAFKPINTTDALSQGGYISAFAPMWDNSGRMIVSWTACRIQDGDKIRPCLGGSANEQTNEADPFYGMWVYDPSAATLLPIIYGKADYAITDIELLQVKNVSFPAEPPSSIIDENLKTAGLGMMHIRSIYDMTGTDITDQATSVSSIAQASDPTLSTRSERTPQFLRLIKPMPIPDRDIVNNIRAQNYDGINGAPMTEIIGYVPIEPDGSAKFVVPASVPFGFEIVDAKGQRLSSPSSFATPHRRWIQVMPGEVKECRGCHARSGDESRLPHGRLDAETDSIHLGLIASGDPYPNTNADLFGDIGQSMAEVFDSATQRSANFDRRVPSLNINYKDVWAQSPAQAETDQNSVYRWFEVNGVLPAGTTALLTFTAEQVSNPEGTELESEKALPVNRGCEAKWQKSCRSVINYPMHIQPLWEKPRPVANTGAVADNDGMITCVQCHKSIDGAQQIPPDGQLDLTSGVQIFSNVTTSFSLISAALNELRQVQNEGEVVKEGLNAAQIALIAQAIGVISNTGVANCSNTMPPKSISYCNLLTTNLKVQLDEDNEVIPLLEIASLPNITTPEQLSEYIKTRYIDADTGEIDVEGALELATILADIIELTTPSMSGRGAASSGRFFSRFNNPLIQGSVNHIGLLNDGEIRLLTEWLDLGAQYYNNVFDVPGAQ